jgi:hypothetical protein
VIVGSRGDGGDAPPDGSDADAPGGKAKTDEA